MEAFTCMVLPRQTESPSSLSLGNGLGSSLPSIGLRSVSASGLPHMGSFGGSLNLVSLDAPSPRREALFMHYIIVQAVRRRTTDCRHCATACRSHRIIRKQEEILGELAQAQTAALGVSQQHQQIQQRSQQQRAEYQQRVPNEAQQHQQQPPLQRLMLPPTSFSFPAPQSRGNM